MIDTQTIAAAIEKLRDAGIDIVDVTTLESLSRLVEQATGRKRSPRVPASEFIYMYVAPKVPPRQIPPFRPLVTTPHFRAAEIDAAQPPVMTPCMVGNGAENSKVWTR